MADLEYSCGFGRSGQLRERDAVHATHPARQVALVGEAGARGDLGKARLPLTHKLDRTLQPQVHDVAVRRHADRSGEDAREMKWAAPGDACELGDLDRLVQTRDDVGLEPLEHVLAQHASHLAFGRRRMARD